MNIKNSIHYSQLLLLSALLWSSLISAKPVKLEISPAQNLILANQPQTIYLKIGLTGLELSGKQRTPVNIGLVLDKSGSMQGLKLQRAKEAAIMAIKRLSMDDIASVIAYDGNVEVIQPATKVLNTEDISMAIRNIRPGGSTALFAGVSKGANEVRKFMNHNQINRVILLSDGKANVGPQTPHELGMLGEALSQEGISVTTIGLGLGYNEDLMQTLARHSGGNHAFAENPNDLTRIFQNEFNDVLSVVASDVHLRIKCMPGIKPLRVLGQHAYISNSIVDVNIKQIYSRQEKYIILEVEIPAIAANKEVLLASISTYYNNPQKRSKDSLNYSLKIQTSTDNEKVASSINNNVMTAAIEFLSAQHNERAISLRDQGKTKEAQKILNDSADYIHSNATRYKSKRLESLARKQRSRAMKLEGKNWGVTRKKLRQDIHKLETQQTWQ